MRGGESARRWVAGGCGLAVWLAAVCIALPAAGQSPFVFVDAGDEAGLFPEVGNIAGHGAAWGDITGEGFPDLYVGTFGGSPYGSKGNRLFLSRDGKRFEVDPQETLRVLGRAGSAVFVDFDNDGDLDLYLSNHNIGNSGFKKEQVEFWAPNFLWRNDGGGKFVDISEASGSRPADFRSRAAVPVDLDGDGWLDLVLGECFFQGGEGRSKVLRNTGGLKFEDVTRQVGIPERISGLGAAAADVTGDGYPDLFFAGREGGNRLLINDGRGALRVVPESHANFAWEFGRDPDNTTCGVCFGDVNRDGRLDIVIGQHFSRPWLEGGVPVRLYLNRGMDGGWPRFEEVTQRVGLVPLPMKGPHVEIQDFDNDGWPDIYVSMVKFADGKPHPLIFRNLGTGSDGLRRFREHCLGVNDFPTEEDLKIGSVGKFFDKMIQDGKIVYTAPGPTADYNRDGRLDMFLANWWTQGRSLLLRNETPGGHWLQVQVLGSQGVNRMGIGSAVRVYPAGKLGQPEALLGNVEISTGYGYASGQEAIAHFGLGEVAQVDVEVILPHRKGKLQQRDVAADQRITLKR